MTGGGTVEGTPTDAQGIFTARWTLGPALGAVHQLRALTANRAVNFLATRHHASRRSGAGARSSVNPAKEISHGETEERKRHCLRSSVSPCEPDLFADVA